MQIALGSLNAFDAAARLLSFKAAAEELHLSPSAVSHAIAKLERDLGTVLFDREGRRLALTMDGRALHGPVEEALGLVRAGLKAVASRQANVLRLHAAPSFASQWLTPRLQAFLAAHPGIEVQIAADTAYTRFTNDEFDADIVYGANDQDGLISHSLGEEVIQPLCTPEMASRISEPADLVGQMLLSSTLKSVQWGQWLRANGVEGWAGSTMRFDRSFMALNAAADGLGVCLDSPLLAERELTSGRLVAPLAGKSIDLTEVGHRLVYPRRSATRPTVRAFTRWLLAELGRPGP